MNQIASHPTKRIDARLIPIMNCKVHLIITWVRVCHCFIAPYGSMTNNSPISIIFVVDHTSLLKFTICIRLKTDT